MRIDADFATAEVPMSCSSFCRKGNKSCDGWFGGPTSRWTHKKLNHGTLTSWWAWFETRLPCDANDAIRCATQHHVLKRWCIWNIICFCYSLLWFLALFFYFWALLASLRQPFCRLQRDFNKDDRSKNECTPQISKCLTNKEEVKGQSVSISFRCQAEPPFRALWTAGTPIWNSVVWSAAHFQQTERVNAETPRV